MWSPVNVWQAFVLEENHNVLSSDSSKCLHQHNSKLGLVSRHFKPNSTDWKQYNTVETIPLYFSAVVRFKHMLRKETCNCYNWMYNT